MKVFRDNDSAARIGLVGSPRPHPQSLAIDIFQFCLAKRIFLDTQWIPRSENKHAGHARLDFGQQKPSGKKPNQKLLRRG